MGLFNYALIVEYLYTYVNKNSKFLSKFLSVNIKRKELEHEQYREWP